MSRPKISGEIRSANSVAAITNSTYAVPRRAVVTRSFPSVARTKPTLKMKSSLSMVCGAIRYPRAARYASISPFFALVSGVSLWIAKEERIAPARLHQATGNDVSFGYLALELLNGLRVQVGAGVRMVAETRTASDA